MTLILASDNHHKVQEIRNMCPALARVLSLQDFKIVPKVIEDADTLQGNAVKKAETLGRWLLDGRGLEGLSCEDEGLWVLADDSGLEVDALDGAPGVRSARFASISHHDSPATGNAPDADNNAKLLRLLAEVPPGRRRARFRCVLALVKLRNDLTMSAPFLFEGACEGSIGLQASGTAGFGYDPLFIPEGFDRSFADLGQETKNRISHRSQALTELRSFLTQSRI